MKQFLTLVLMIVALNGYADIDSVANAISTPPSATEVSSNRACFSSLERLGCGDPGDDIEHFRSCMNNVFEDLAPSCQKLMDDLYKAK